MSSIGALSTIGYMSPLRLAFLGVVFVVIAITNIFNLRQRRTRMEHINPLDQSPWANIKRANAAVGGLKLPYYFSYGIAAVSVVLIIVAGIWRIAS